MSFLFSFGVRVAFVPASLALALAPTACSSSSSSGCSEAPTPDPTLSVPSPCGLTFASVGVSGPCQSGGTPYAPTVTGTGSGTCTVNATFSNGAHATGSVTFAATAYCSYYSPSADVVTLTVSGASGCDAGAASDGAAD